MSEKKFSSKELFAFDDNGVPPVIRDCFIALISPLEELFSDGQVPSGSSRHPSHIPDPSREPLYPVSSDFKKDWLEWIFLEIKARLNLGIHYYNLRGEILEGADKKRTPIILFLRKFRKIQTWLSNQKDQEPNVALRAMGTGQIALDGDYDTVLRGQIERRFPSYPVLWIANPVDALSFSGYLTREDQAGGELNENSYPYSLSPMWSRMQRWQESAEYLIRASNAIVIANISKEGGIGEEQELIYSASAMDRAFVTHPENLDPPYSGFGRVDDLTEEKLHHLKGADHTYLGKLAGWGHWAGFDSLEYARQYIGAIDELWGSILDSGKEVSPGYFAALFTALMSLLVFRGELKEAGQIAQGLAGAIAARSRGEQIQFLRGGGEFHSQDIRAFEVLLEVSKWYSEKDELYRLVVGFDALERATRENAIQETNDA
jgi:hypothetical protein